MRKLLYLAAAIPAMLFAQDASAAPNIDVVGQEQNNWGWAAVSQMVIQGVRGTHKVQCGLADEAFNRTDCCPLEPACNTNWPYFQSVRQNGIQVYSYAAPQQVLTIGGLKQEIDANRPVVAVRSGGPPITVVANVFQVFGTALLTVHSPTPTGAGNTVFETYEEWLGSDETGARYLEGHVFR